MRMISEHNATLSEHSHEKLSVDASMQNTMIIDEGLLWQLT
jgi:hypothetical protein